MAGPVAEIEKILTEEIHIYSSLYELEEKKSAIILGKDGKALETISIEQETLLSRVAKLEKSRKKQITVYAERNHLHDLPREITLTDVVRLMDEDSSHRLLRTGMELKSLIVKLSSLHKTNERLIQDNLDFFNMLLSGLKSSVSVNTGYCEKGMERSKVAGSLIFNKTV